MATATGEKMKKWIGILSLAFLCACYQNRALMTSDEFAAIPLGATAKEVEAEHGSPYKIYSRGGNTDEWEYIERIDVGSRIVSQNHYFLIMTNGKVVGKHMDTTRPPPFRPTQTDDPFPHNG